MNEHESRLLELAERIETAASQAITELAAVRPKPGAYADSAYRDLANALDRLRACCDTIRYGLERDRLMP